jgi:hypothetical protein
MSTQFKISITKDIIDRAKHCGTENDIYQMGRNCAIALALKDIFPEVYVTNYLIFPFGIDANDEKDVKIPLPTIAQQFIKLFDGFYLTPNLRLLLPQFEFMIDIPDEVINAINIDEIKELIRNSKKSCHTTHTV